MDKTMKDNWDEAINLLMELPKERRDHFALLLLNLAKCYTDHDHWKAVIIINNEDAMLTFSAGATEAESMEMLQLANEAVVAAATVDAPPKEMFN